MSSQKPTILHVIDTTGPGGAETVFLDLAENLQVKNMRTLALIKGPGWVQDQLVARGIEFRVLKPYGFMSVPYYFSFFKLLKAENVQFMQAHLLGSALTCSIASLLTRVPVVATLHGQVDLNPQERFLRMKRWLLNFGANRIVTVSNQLADYFKGKKLITDRKLSVIHNGIDVSLYDITDSGRIRRELQLESSSVLIGALGNIRPAKDYPTLIEAAALALKTNPKLHFVIAGHSKQPLQSELDALAKELGIEKNIHFLGFQNDTPEFLNQLDLFVLSSSAEGFSIATLEAMAAKIPVVATRCGGPEEIITANKDGYLVTPGDSDDLAKCLLSALSSENKETVDEALSTVKQRFSREKLVSSYLDLVNKISNRSSRQYP